jgi:hypothetical protein
MNDTIDIIKSRALETRGSPYIKDYGKGIRMGFQKSFIL